MESEYLLFAANSILLVHVLFVAFVVLGLPLIFTGRIVGWSWVRNRWFRITHLLSIVYVVAQSWVGVVCPLTSIEMALRAAAGDAVYAGSFIAHWLHALLFYDLPASIFVFGYTAFGVLVVASWLWVPPNSR